MSFLALGLVLALALVLAGWVYQELGERRDRRRYPPPGRLLEAGGSLLHVHSAGSGSPTIVLEAGIAASSVSWVFVGSALQSQFSVVSYDRAGLAWSGRCELPRTSEQILKELEAVLGSAPRPCILVGHSFGALITLLLTSRRPELVAGLVMVDPALLHEWAEPTPQRLAMLARGIALARRGATLARIGVVRFALDLLSSGARWLPKAVNRASSGRGASVTERLVGEVRKLPPEIWPAVQSHWSRPQCFESMAQHLKALPEVTKHASRVESLGDVPLVVISGAHLSDEGIEEHQRLAKLSTRGRHIRSSSGGHWVHLDEPQIVVDAVHWVASYL